MSFHCLLGFSAKTRIRDCVCRCGCATEKKLCCGLFLVLSILGCPVRIQACVFQSIDVVVQPNKVAVLCIFLLLEVISACNQAIEEASVVLFLVSRCRYEEKQACIMHPLKCDIFQVFSDKTRMCISGYYHSTEKVEEIITVKPEQKKDTLELRTLHTKQFEGNPEEPGLELAEEVRDPQGCYEAIVSGVWRRWKDFQSQLFRSKL